MQRRPVHIDQASTPTWMQADQAEPYLASSDTAQGEGVLDARLEALRSYARDNGVSRMPPWLRRVLEDDPGFAEEGAQAEQDRAPEPPEQEELEIIDEWDPSEGPRDAGDEGETQKPEVQEPEVQEPEVQEPEVQEQVVPTPDGAQEQVGLDRRSAALPCWVLWRPVQMP